MHVSVPRPPSPILVPASYTAMATLAVPDPGRYAVWSKAIIGNTKVIAVRCRLVAGSDVDESLVNGGDFTFFTISNTVVHEFAEPGVVELQCRRDTGGDPPRAWNIKIVAVKVGSLSNRPS